MHVGVQGAGGAGGHVRCHERCQVLSVGQVHMCSRAAVLLGASITSAACDHVMTGRA